MNARRTLSSHYIHVKSIIFCIDSTRPDLFPLVQEEISNLLTQPSLYRIPLLLVLTKQDSKDALKPKKIRELLNLEHLLASGGGVGIGSSVKARRPWAVVGSSSITGQGIENGMNWIVDTVGRTLGWGVWKQVSHDAPIENWLGYLW